jgi:pimeloyl-ACP methyl ester carboxylesterase
VQKRLPVPARQCVDRESFPHGTRLTARTSDDFTARGFLFSPPESTPAKGLVVYLHGGPRDPYTNLLTTPFDKALLERGYAIAAVNYRGGTGYGRSHLEKPYGGGFSGMIEDADAIKRAALGALNLSASAPVLLHGASYGGFLAIKGAVERVGEYRAVIIDAGVCRLASSIHDLSYAGGAPLPLNTSRDPDVGIHMLQIATNVDGTPVDVDLCATRVTGSTKVIVIHSRGDPIASFARIQAFAELQDKKRMASFFVDGEAHDPMRSISSDPTTFAKVVDGLVAFIEAPTAKIN